MPEETQISQDLADRKAEAEIAKLLAEAEAAARGAAANEEKAHAEAEAAEQAAAKTALETQILTIGLKREQEKRLRELASNEFHHVYYFSQDVRHDSVQKCMDMLQQWHRNEPGCDMEIIFNSPGGSIVDGMALWDFVQVLRSEGHHVTTSALGMAASMAGILLQAGDKRVMGRESWVLIHEASFFAGGKIGEVEDTVTWVKKVQERIIKIFVERAQAANTATKPLTAAQIKKQWTRTDWWISSDEALQLGLVDELR
jgi:Vilmaviridae head maturation protease